MVLFDFNTGLLASVIAIGLVHGVEPGHGWPVAASYALGRRHKWGAGLLAGLVIGVGHLVSSVAMVALFLWAKGALGLHEVGWMNYVAGALLILLGVREYRHGRAHAQEAGGDDHHERHGHDHGNDDRAPRDGHTHEYSEDHEHADDSDTLLARALAALPLVGGGGHGHGDRHGHGFGADDADERGLWGIAAFAFALGSHTRRSSRSWGSVSEPTDVSNSCCSTASP